METKTLAVSEVSISEKRQSSGKNISETGNFNGSGLRLMIYSHDTFGLGHLQRCLKISRALADVCPRLSILIVTGSPLVHRFDLPGSVDYVKLPAVRKVGPEQYEARSLGTSYNRILSLRTGILFESVKSFSPHLMLVDHSPRGMKGEMLPALKWIREELRDCSVVLGLRDVIDDPKSVIKHWKDEGIYDDLRTFYDHIIVYGSSDIFDLTRAYDFTEDLKKKTTFCDFVCDRSERSGATQKDASEPQYGNRSDDEVDLDEIKKTSRQIVTVTIGGGDGAGETVVGTYLKMLSEYKSQIDFHTVILTGPFISPQLLERFKEGCDQSHVTLKTFIKSTRRLLEESDLIVATGGYNTVTEILCYARRAILIPRAMYRQEQLMRASQLADMGIVDLVRPDEVTPQLLFERVRNLLSSDREPISEARSNDLIHLDGAEKVATFCTELLREKVIENGVGHE